MGIFYGLISSATFGLISLFALPLMKGGITVETTLVYRFVIAMIFLGTILGIRGERFACRYIDLIKIMFLSSLYLGAVLLFFHSFKYLPSSIVAILQFLYPVMVLIIMVIFFHEPLRPHIVAAVTLGVAGAILLTSGPGLDPAVNLEATATPEINLNFSGVFFGVTIALLSGLCNALYYVGLQVAKIQNLSGLVITFYVMFFGAFFCLGNAIAQDSLQWISDLWLFFLAFLLAIVTAVLSNFTLIMAIQRIGSTMTAILGVMEPVTAVTVGILVFNEQFGMPQFCGFALVVCSVILVMLGPKLFRLANPQQF